MSAKHGANSWDDYLTVHQSRIADFLGHFILDDRLQFTRTPQQDFWDGVLLCADSFEIHVEKRQAVTFRSGRAWVQTEAYSYQVLRRPGSDVVRLFRYDNAPHHGHADPHHRHRYDANGLELLPPQHVREEGWPTLGEVINEAFELWRGHCDRSSGSLHRCIQPDIDVREVEGPSDSRRLLRRRDHEGVRGLAERGSHAWGSSGSCAAWVDPVSRSMSSGVLSGSSRSRGPGP